MKPQLHTDDLATLMKVFDANYVSDDDCRKLSGFDPRESGDLRKAVALLLVPEFLTYSEEARTKLVGALRDAISDEHETFEELFDRIGPAFEFEVDDNRAFMASLLQAVEQEGIA